MDATFSLPDLLAEIPDPRRAEAKRHPLPAVLSLVVLATMAGMRGLQGVVDFGRNLPPDVIAALGFTRSKTLAKSTLSEILRAIDITSFEAVVSRWLQRQADRCGWTAIAIGRGLFPPDQQRCREAAGTYATTVDKGHGRRERRTVIASTELTTDLRPHWPGLGQVYQITRERRRSGGLTVEVAYRITSLKPAPANASRQLELDRGHRGIENGLHHVRDVTLGEDACRVRSGEAPQVLAAARNLALGMLRSLSFASIAAATRRIVMHPIEGLRRIIEKI